MAKLDSPSGEEPLLRILERNGNQPFSIGSLLFSDVWRGRPRSIVNVGAAVNGLIASGRLKVVASENRAPLQFEVTPPRAPAPSSAFRLTPGDAQVLGAIGGYWSPRRRAQTIDEVAIAVNRNRWRVMSAVKVLRARKYVEDFRLTQRGLSVLAQLAPTTRRPERAWRRVPGLLPILQNSPEARLVLYAAGAWAQSMSAPLTDKKVVEMTGLADKVSLLTVLTMAHAGIFSLESLTVSVPNEIIPTSQGFASLGQLHDLGYIPQPVGLIRTAQVAMNPHLIS